ncbi:MAG: hypothetical protein WCO60_19540 [Verrucomicrobiota bacterium]
MKPKAPFTHIIRGTALGCLLLALYPGVVAIDTPLDQQVKGALESKANPGAAASTPTLPDEKFTETTRWVVRIGVPLRPFATGYWTRILEGKTNGQVRVTSAESTSSWTYGDPVGLTYSALLIVSGIILLRISRRDPNADTAP